MIVSKEEALAQLDAVDVERQRWIPRVRADIVALLGPVHDVALHQARMGTTPDQIAEATRVALAATRDAWVDLLVERYTTIGTATAVTAGVSLARRTRTDIDPNGSQFQGALHSFLRAYTTAYVPERVDRVLTSVLIGVKTLVTSPQLAPVKASVAIVAVDTPTPIPADETSLELDDMFNNAADIVSEMEAVTATNLGPFAAVAAVMAAGRGAPNKQWVSRRDYRVRRNHSEADGQVRLLAQPFLVGSSQLLFPMDESYGADLSEVIHCRCGVALG